MYKIIISLNGDIFTSGFPIYNPFVSFSCHIKLAKISNIILNRSSENEHLCLVSDMRKLSGFSSFDMMMARGLQHLPFNKLRYVPSIPSFSSTFTMKGY